MSRLPFDHLRSDAYSGGLPSRSSLFISASSSPADTASSPSLIDGLGGAPDGGLGFPREYRRRHDPASPRGIRSLSRLIASLSLVAFASALAHYSVSKERNMPLLEARKQYKPFEYPWAFEYWKRQQQIHWMPEEVPLGEDCRDWAQKLDRPRAQPADADLPLLHPGRRRGAGLLPRQIRPRVQADRDQDDAGRVLQHGDGAHRRLLAPARHHRHARERVLAPSSSTRR